MKIFRLDPIDLEYPGWRYSTHKGPLVIRAESEDDARMIAQLTCGIAAEVVPDQEVSLPPWAIPHIVLCAEVKDSRFSSVGDRKVLEPSCLNF